MTNDHAEHDWKPELKPFMKKILFHFTLAAAPVTVSTGSGNQFFRLKK